MGIDQMGMNANRRRSTVAQTEKERDRQTQRKRDTFVLNILLEQTKERERDKQTETERRGITLIAGCAMMTHQFKDTPSLRNHRRTSFATHQKGLAKADV